MGTAVIRINNPQHARYSGADGKFEDRNHSEREQKPDGGRSPGHGQRADCGNNAGKNDKGFFSAGCHNNSRENGRKQARLIRLAGHYLSRHRLQNRACRFDVVLFKGGAAKPTEIEHIENAFEVPGEDLRW